MQSDISVDFENEAKIKEIEKTSQADLYDFEIEEMENDMEESTLEAGLYSKSDMYNTPSVFSTLYSNGESELEISGEESVKRSSDVKTRDFLRERWRMMTGRKPNNIPNLRILRSDEVTKEIILFGNKRPAEIERERKLDWSRKVVSAFEKKPPINYGVIHHEVRVQSTFTRGFMCVRFHKSGNYITTSCRNGGVQVRNSNTGEVLWHVNTTESNSNLPVGGLRHHPHIQNRLYVGGGSGIVQIFNIANKESIGKSGYIGTINNLDLNANGGTVVTVGKEGRIVLLDAATLQIIAIKQKQHGHGSSRSEDKYHKSRIYGMKFHPNYANIFVTGGWDKTVKVWDIRVPAAVRNIRGPMISGDSVDVRGEMILTGSWSCEDSLHLWHLPSAKLLHPIPLKKNETRYEGEFLMVCQFFKLAVNEDPPNNNLVVVGGSGFNNVDVMRVSDSKLLASFPSYKPVSSMDTHASRIAYGGQESLLRIGELCYSKNWRSSYF